MREIKFKVWDKRNLTMSEGFTLEQIRSGTAQIPESPEDCELLEWTGQKDENGKEIYEADIVSIVDPSGDDAGKDEVIWADSAFLIQPDRYDTKTVGWAQTEGFKLEVVGNRWEDRDLLRPPGRL